MLYTPITPAQIYNGSSTTDKASGIRHLSIRFLKLVLKVHVIQEARTVIKVWHAVWTLVM